MLASSFLDPVLGIDVHFEMVPTPAPVPTPIPNPFIGVVFDPLGLAAGIASGLRSEPWSGRRSSSNSPQSCTLVDGIALASTDVRQGLAVGETLLSELFDRLAAHRPIPPALAEKEPDLTPDDWRAAMRVVAHILRAFDHAPASDDGR